MRCQSRRIRVARRAAPMRGTLRAALVPREDPAPGACACAPLSPPRRASIFSAVPCTLGGAISSEDRSRPTPRRRRLAAAAAAAGLLRVPWARAAPRRRPRRRAPAACGGGAAAVAPSRTAAAGNSRRRCRRRWLLALEHRQRVGEVGQRSGGSSRHAGAGAAGAVGLRQAPFETLPRRQAPAAALGSTQTTATARRCARRRVKADHHGPPRSEYSGSVPTLTIAPEVGGVEHGFSDSLRREGIVDAKKACSTPAPCRPGDLFRASARRRRD